ncbi:hypothetical protein B0T16DRAFT_162598 [Cercophora newfieldiana]|uniref:C2H2-type domain-containing protein n=1 Tax=Cercophora newfieldiana TaxID=92897 RepID=A0AA39Y8J4_9PEZI|nr:hypothetical protein B0T16DRAFT_162598 [Cercophora newfieldiana]
MSTEASSHLAHAQASDLYDPDDVLPKNSPLMKPTRVTLRLSPTAITVPNPTTQPSQGDAVLVGTLDGGRRPDIAFQAGCQALPPDIEEEDEPISEGSESSSEGSVGHPGHHGSGGPGWDGRARTPGGKAGAKSMAVNPPDTGDMGAFDLKSLAAGALAFAIPDAPPGPIVDAGPTPPVSENDVAKERRVPTPLSHPIAIRRGEPGKDDRPIQPGVPSPYSPRSLYSPREAGAVPLAPPNGLPPPAGHGEGLPPIQINSPRSESSGQTPLPSIRAQLGDFNQLASNHAAEKERLRNPHHAFPHSPPANLPRLPSMHHGSPPISPAETFRRDPLSPNHPYTPSYYQQGYGMHRTPHDYGSSATVTPGSEQSGSTPAASITEKMSIEGITIQSAVYVCKYQGCTAAPFQTQYLLNSHANVHSSNRPHYCPVKGCPRSEGGKGFKRKNEMIRHGLVHDSPGYVCPFCPDREHKYPRPDNLQRHVRVHHVDKDKDDPMLRDVLAQRPDGPNKGRRRRGIQG